MKFTELPIYNGVGDIHVNQFRIHFRVPGLKGDPKQQVGTLVKDFTARFPEFFNGAERALKQNLAKVVWGNQLFNGKHKTLKFTIGMTAKAPTHFAMGEPPYPLKASEYKPLFDLPDIHSDWVYIVWNDPSKGFAAQTVRAEPSDGKFGSALSIRARIEELNNNHFLAGRRSWVLGLLEKQGGGPGSPPTFFLETGAVERYSSAIIQLVAAADPGFVVDMRKAVVSIWSFMLSNYVKAKWFQLDMSSPSAWEGGDRGVAWRPGSEPGVVYKEKHFHGPRELRSDLWVMGDLFRRHPALATQPMDQFQQRNVGAKVS